MGKITIDGIDNPGSLRNLVDLEDVNELEVVPLLVSEANLPLTQLDTTIQFTQPFALNVVDPKRMLIGTNFLYESSDQGDTLSALGGVVERNGSFIPNARGNVRGC